METRDLPSAIIKAISHTNLNRRRLFFPQKSFHKRLVHYEKWVIPMQVVGFTVARGTSHYVNARPCGLGIPHPLLLKGYNIFIG